MIESIMYLGIGFLSAALSVLFVVPLVHGRAVRLTTRRLERAPPPSITEVLVSKDLLRAEFAMSTRLLEMNVEELKTKSAGQLADIGRKADAINRLKTELGDLNDQLRAIEKESAIKATALQDAERALSDKALEVTKLVRVLDERSRVVESQTAKNLALKTKLGAVSDQLRATEEESALKAAALQNAERGLSDRTLELTRLVGVLEKRTGLAESQKAEIVALRMQVQTQNGRLTQADDEVRAAKNLCDAEHVMLEATTRKLTEERTKFENFHRRVAELVQQLMAQSPEAKALHRRAQDLEYRLTEQSRLFKESEIELGQLRAKTEMANKAEADRRTIMVEIDSRAKAATRNLMAEKAQLQAALDRTKANLRVALDQANGERTRLARENAMLRERVNGVAAQQARRVANG